ncbi:retrovirus-related pol polyprotein from transposon TNT 1-94 [Tanacetum coccineum]|uniref:Retrovirus-related pol polyprotein from transposon TNT 1-94 n=1 Tax=Tanacetum coccineum TaxID=301880 RepID=A0ABQ4YYX3_9ASTR
MACGFSWKTRLSTLNDENVFLKTQVDYVIQERENIKLEYQKLFNSIKATRTQHQQEVDELIEHVNQNTYAYDDVRSQNQYLLMTISELKNKLKTIEKGKNVNTKFDKSDTLGKPLCVESSNSFIRPKSKDTKSKNKALKNTNDKSSSAHVWKVSSSVSIDSNKRELMNSIVCQTNASVLNTKIVNVVNDGLNIVCASCGKDVFMLSHEKCVARYALSRDSKVKRALFTTLKAANSKNLGATSVDAKSRLSVAKIPIATNKNLEGDDLLTGSRESNLYTISISKLAASSPVCLMSKATSTKSWLWHRRLSHLNFGTINQLMLKDLVDGVLKFKYDKDHLCLACKQGKGKKAFFPPNLVPNIESKLELLHMDLCGPMRVESINGKKYILVIVDDYSRYTWVYFLRTKDEAPDMIINFINQV